MKKNMRKIVLIPFLAVLAVFLAVTVFSYSSWDLGDHTDYIATEFNGIYLDDSDMTMAGFTGEVVPVRVAFEAVDSVEDVRIKVWLEGTRDDIKAETGRFNIINGSIYSKLLSLELPEDIRNTEKEYTLHVSITSSKGYDHVEYNLKMQRESYDFKILSVDYDDEVSAGDSVPVRVVIKNTGMEELEDGYIQVSVDELGISAKRYLGDLTAEDEEEDDEKDSIERIVYLEIPEDAENGVYEMSVEAYNEDTNTVVRKLIKVEGAASTQVLSAVKNQDMKAGETITYDLIIVNSGSKVRAYNIQTVSGNLHVSAPSVVTVGPGSSQTIPITVTAPKNAELGSYTFSVNVDKQEVIFGANVVSTSVSSGIVALTVVLVIVFVVLLIVLIVLLTRKEKPIEEVETSYY